MKIEAARGPIERGLKVWNEKVGFEEVGNVKLGFQICGSWGVRFGNFAQSAIFANR